MTLTDLGRLATLRELALLDYVDARNRRDDIAADALYAESRRLKHELEEGAARYAREHADELRAEGAASDAPAVAGPADLSSSLASSVDDTMRERFWKEGPFR